VYYSIDQCIPPNPSTTKASSSSSTAQLSSPAVSSVASSSIGTSSSEPTTKSAHSNHIGAIVGGVIGGVVAVAVAVAVAIYMILKRRKTLRPTLNTPIHELDGSGEKKELPANNQAEFSELHGSVIQTKDNVRHELPGESIQK
jgi:hypothetical protein